MTTDDPNQERNKVLAELRNKLDKVDSDLIKTVADRQRLVEEIGRIKRRTGHQTRDFAREKVVLEKAANEAQGYGLDPQVAKDILALLIRASLTSQEQARIRSNSPGDGRSVLVIGGAGRMGGWFVEYFHSLGYVVTVADPAPVASDITRFEDWREAGVDFDIIVVATTLARTAQVLSGLCELKPRGLVFDVGSLKTPLREPLLALARAGVQVTSVHPMFGPNTRLLADRQIIFVDVGVSEATNSARELFSNTMALAIDMSIDEHDRMIAFVLGLAHITNIIFVDALARSGIEASQLLAMSSPTFDAQVRMGRTVVHENPQLYYEIQSLNGLGKTSRNALRDAVEAVLTAIETEDESEFVRLMFESREFLDRTYDG